MEEFPLDAFCPNCGEKFVGNAKFCSSCGLAVTRELAAFRRTTTQHRTPGAALGDTAPPYAYDASTADPIERLNSALEGRYAVERVLGHGGMATVYLAKDVRHDREVAIKVLLPELSASIGGERFEQEIRLAAKLQHPHILGLFDSGSALGLLYYVMPFVKGESLRDRLEREGPLPVEDAIVITLEVADALGYAHAQGIIHRDIKPENIMLSGGHALVADFGIARAATEAGVQKLTQTGMALGTPIYMSPEQSGGDQVGPPADVYSLACVLYEMLAGEPPFTGKSAVAIMARHAMEQVPSIRIIRSSVPEEVEAAIFAGMGKLPADRPRSAQAFADYLRLPMALTGTTHITGPTGMRRVPSGSQLLYRPQGLPPESASWWRRPGVVGAAASAALAGMFGAWFLSRGAPARATGENSRRVAVLYFTDQSKKKDLGSLADGLTEGLITSLSNASSITIISRAGAERFRGSALAPDSIARVLRAGYLVVGDVDREGQNIVVNVRLEDRSGTDVSRKSIRMAETKQIAMREPLENAVSDLIRSAVGAEIQLREERDATSNQNAWLELQRGEQSRRALAGILAKGDTVAVDRAVASTDSMFAHAETLDPKWIEPIVRRAWLAYQRSRSVGRDPTQIRKWVDQGLVHANHALALNADNPDALEVRGDLGYWSWLSNLETDASRKLALLANAQADLEHATRVNPKQAGAFATLVHLYTQVPSKTSTDVYIAATKAYDADEFVANANMVLNRLFIAEYDLPAFDKAKQHCKVFAERFPQDYRSKRCQLFMLTTPLAPPFDRVSARRIADSSVAMRPPKDSVNERLSTNLLLAAAMARASQLQPLLADSARRLAKSSEGDAQVDPNRDLTFYAAFAYLQLHDTDNAIRVLKEYLAANPQRAASLREDPGWWFKDLASTGEWKQLVGTK